MKPKYEEPSEDHWMFTIFTSLFILGLLSICAHGFELLDEIDKAWNPQTRTVREVVEACDVTLALPLTLSQQFMGENMWYVPAGEILDLVVGLTDFNTEDLPPNTRFYSMYTGQKPNEASFVQLYDPITRRSWLTIFPDNFVITGVYSCGTYEMLVQDE